MFKNVIIDFGGVLYRINLQNAVSNLKNFTSDIDRFNQRIDNKEFDSVLIDYEKGLISTTNFITNSIKLLNLKCTNQEFDIAWNSILIQLEEDAVSNIKSLKRKYNVVLLSNTNSMHYKHFHTECKDLFSLFDDCFFSYKIGFHKPELEIYEHVIEKMNYYLDETIFIDDSLKNIQAAQILGLNTFLVEDYNLSNIVERLDYY